MSPHVSIRSKVARLPAKYKHVDSGCGVSETESASVHTLNMASSWKDGLSRAGLYFDGIIEESKLQEVLELHKRDTVSTFGTRSSRRVSKNCNRTELQSNTKESVIGSSSDETTLAVDKENVCLQSEGAAEELAAPEHKVVGINIMHKVYAIKIIFTVLHYF